MSSEWARFAPISASIRTSLPADQTESSYDRMALGYDLLVGNGIYNHVVWGCPKSAYEKAASDFLKHTPPGPILDYGCGSLVFTSNAYRPFADRLMLFDRSLGMLRRGESRLPEGRFLQGDAFAPPFAEGSFTAAMSWGMLHVFGSGSAYLEKLAGLLAPRAPVTLTMLVLSGRTIGDRMLHMLHKKGEAAMPEMVDHVTSNFKAIFQIDATVQIGSMLFVTGRKL
jgi:ubiquinone/menaquinone biosynthesis C-methylase UbiE